MNNIIPLEEIFIIILGFSGFFLSLYLHRKKKKNKEFVCFLKANCHTVIQSRYSKFLGVELSFFGMAYYSFIILVYAVSLIMGGIPAGWLFAIVIGITAIATSFSIYLTILQAFVIKEWCSWCLTSAIMSTIIFLLSTFGFNINVIDVLATTSGFMQVLHSIVFAIGVGATTIGTAFFFKFLKDRKISEWEAGVLHVIAQVSWFSLGILILSGLAFYIPNAQSLNLLPLFLVQMLIVVIILINSLLMHIVVEPRLLSISFGKPQIDHEKWLSRFRRITFVLGGISIASWYTAYVFNRLQNASISFGAGIVIYLLIILISISISLLTEWIFNRSSYSE